ncbi:hypothetical protein C5167_045447 [Papaver somniferum]|uniref:DUF7866 domain-containing protein n=1 Tax=Papaver somniferum TaxID=3469 RepID=A0A4Y7LED9_PAPSO|nr:uncharacterized protein LOC113323504 [Papaver somniferum]RZC82661.1 hypothetical protein C5167_045447 [Papaver somniferum]
MKNLTMKSITIPVLLLLFLTQFSASFSTTAAKGYDDLNNSTKSSELLNNQNNNNNGLMIPAESEVYRVFDDLYGYNYNNEQGKGLRRRKLEPFQLCLECKCCPPGAGTDPTTCTTMPCCFGIDCQIPNKPYGECAFVPKTCNCTSCAV